MNCLFFRSLVNDTSLHFVVSRGFGVVDLTAEALLASTGVSAVAAIGYARAGGSRSVAAGAVVQARLDACVALYGGRSLTTE